MSDMHKSVYSMSLEELQDEVLIARQRLDALRRDDNPSFRIAVELGMSGKEKLIFQLMHMRMDSIVRKETMMDWLYSDQLDIPDSKIIDVFICKMRKKLVDTPYKIETIWGTGYQLSQMVLAAPVAAE